MHVRTMLEPRANFMQPVTVVTRIEAKLLFNRWVNKNARHFRVFGGELN